MARSSLEEMLDSIRRRDEQPKDKPPALPQRPVKKGRLPSSRRSLPVNFKVGSGLEGGVSNVEKQMEKVDQDKSSEIEQVGFRSGIFGIKRLKIDLQEDSPYDRLPEAETFQEKIQEEDALESVATPATPMVPSAEFGWDGDAEFALKKKLRVWYWISNVKWELGKIQSVLGEEAHVSLSDGRSLTVPTENLLPANPDILDGVEDLIQLSYLNEPSVLYNLEYRYSCDSIYTKAGPVLVAINPFKKVPLYGNNIIQAYRHKLMDGPHVYAIADNAFNEMMRDEVNQSIIISGESGAGKTETAKVAMQYLAALGGGGSGIEYEVLQTNFIMEAFGNARTLRNDNSSRFGKLIEMHFSAVGKICGANIQTFLLEKSRVVQRAKGERSYHIFYQLCAGAPPPLRENLNLKMAKDYEYLKQSDCLMIDGNDDAQSFSVLMAALDVVQIHKEELEKAFAMIAAVLWLGNISFLVIDNENHVDVPVDEGVTSAAKLLGCNAQDLILALSTRKIQAGKENIIRRLTLSQAIDTRDALAKSIYASLFDWLVERINRSLGVGKIYTGRIISILDIYGFESFQKNSFEQFCINYANERLQQHFNRHLFKLEQEEYAQDGIDWTKVDFVDNTECLNLFEKKPLGLLSLLDEESTFPKATDLTLANKLKQHLNSSPCFKEERGGAFKVCHYAGEVRYDTSGFLEKNRDPLHSESIELLFSSTCEFPKLFASTIVEKSQKHPSPLRLSNVDSQKLSVGTKFKDQLFRLMQRLENTTPHFIRCIKPNSKQFPGMYEHNLVLQQLRCCGVLEVVRISRSGYPTRLTHQQFAQRYGFLCSETIASQDPLSVSVAILQHFSVLPDMYQVGYTKLFFRTGQIASLEDSRNRTLQGILGVQKSFRGLQARHCFQQLKRGSTSLQSFIRGEITRNEFELLSKRWKAALNLQKYVKRQIVQRAFIDQKRAAVHVQSAIRGFLSRKQFVFMQELEILKPKHVNYNKKLANGLLEDKGQDSSEEHPQVHPSVLAQLQRRVLKAEAALRQKEVENTMLLQQVHRYETRWFEYETKMKSMEETWQKQMTALQMSLAAARKSIAADDTPQQNGKFDLSTPLYYDSEDTTMSLGTRTPDDTTSRQPHPYDGGLGRVSDGGHHAVNNILKEFDQRKQVFEDDARFVVEVKSAQSGINMNPDEELRKLKLRFTIWKNDYKVRLRETKMTLRKHGNSEAEKSRKNWWGKRIPRLS